MTLLACEVVETQQNIDAAIIWLHGLGASGHDFVPIIPRLAISQTLGIRFVFPHAPEIPITINNGMVMPGWYDIYSLDMDREIDTPQIMASAAAVHDLIQHEIDKGISSERIILAGFSQGGAVVLEAGLSYDKPLAGIMSLSSYFATYSTLKAHPANRDIAIRVDQGTEDNIVLPIMAERSIEKLTELGYQPSYQTYPMGHEVHPQQIDDISDWIVNRLG